MLYNQCQCLPKAELKTKTSPNGHRFTRKKVIRLARKTVYLSMKFCTDKIACSKMVPILLICHLRLSESSSMKKTYQIAPSLRAIEFNLAFNTKTNQSPPKGGISWMLVVYTVFRARRITFFLVNRVQNQNEPKRPQKWWPFGFVLVFNSAYGNGRH